jgi:uncharacterized membrane protein (DUF485 family)
MGKKEKFSDIFIKNHQEIEALWDEEHYLKYGGTDISNDERLERLEKNKLRQSEIDTMLFNALEKEKRSFQKMLKFTRVLCIFFIVLLLILFVYNFIERNFTGAFINLICLVINIKSLMYGLKND